MPVHEARAGYSTRLILTVSDRDPGPRPPASSGLQVVSYPGPLGAMEGLLSGAGGGSGTAMVWLVGGFPVGGWGEDQWSPPELGNDQSARQFAAAGVVTLFPALRGAGGNPGEQESFYGEVDDVLAAIAYVKSLPGVDPARVYLGGHSTGATLAMLVAAAEPEVAGVLALGPVGDPEGYGSAAWLYDPGDRVERELRAPEQFLDAISVPTLVVEGDDGGNIDSLRRMKKLAGNPRLRFLELPDATHFSLIAPVNRLIAAHIASQPKEPFPADEALLGPFR
jgi:pimeloyl-ACP methyl ester carboxylesterase